MIIDAVMPLLVEYGSDITSKQIAEAAGLAEGTIFRAFGDKETLLRAAADKFFDPDTVRAELRSIDASLDLHARITAIIEMLQKRMQGMFRVLTALGRREPPSHPVRDTFGDIVTELLAADIARLSWPPRRIAHALRLVAFASSIPEFQASTGFTPPELASLVLYGVTTKEDDA
jgi:AcrR family transcriptional regulator